MAADYDQIAIEVERAKAGDENAFAALYENTYALVYNIAASRLKSTEDAKDAVSEVYIRVFKYLHTLRDSRSFVRWLMVITDNVCAGRLHDTKDDTALSPLLPEKEADISDPIAEWIQKEDLHQLMQELIRQLPETQQRAIWYVYFKQLTIAQTAAIENCPIGTIKTRLFHARDTLRRAILKEEKRTGDKYHLSAATLAMSAILALPKVGFTLSSAEASGIFISVMTALGLQYTGDRGASLYTVIYEENNDGSLKSRLLRRSYLIRITPAALIVLILCAVLTLTAVARFALAGPLPLSAGGHSRHVRIESRVSADSPVSSVTEPITDHPSAVFGMVTYSYTVNDGEITLTSAQVPEGTQLTELTIPAELDGYPVKHIGEFLFSENQTIETLIIPSPIESIGTEAFFNCTGITELQLPETLRSLGAHAFSYCTSLTELTLPASVRLDTTATSPFANLKSLRTIEVRLGNEQLTVLDDVLYTSDFKTIVLYPAEKPDIVYTLPEETERFAPYSMAGNHLVTLNMSDNVREIGAWAFAFCESLDWMDLSGNLEILGDNGLGAPNLTMLRIRLGKNRFRTSSGALYSNDGSVLYRYPAGKSDKIFTVPDSVTTIAPFAFYRAERLESLTLPDTVTEIKKCALAYMPGICEIRLSESLTELPERALAFNYSVEEYTLPKNLSKLTEDVFSGCLSLKLLHFTGDMPKEAPEVLMLNDDCIILYPENRAGWAESSWHAAHNLQKTK